MLYLVSSKEEREARRAGGAFDGVLGRLSKNKCPSKLHGIFGQSDVKPCDLHGGENRETGFPQDSDFSGQSSLIVRAEKPEDNIYIPAYQTFHRNRSRSWTIADALGFRIFISFVPGAIPFVIIGSLTGFRRQESTVAERVFAMLWRSMNVSFGSLLPHSHRFVGGRGSTYKFNILALEETNAHAIRSDQKRWQISKFYIVGS
jgi:hypothetical protein